VNKVKTFVGALLLGQALLSTATPVLADSYSNDYSEYDSSSRTTQQAKENTNWGEMAVIGLGSLILLNSVFGGGSGESSNQEQTSDRYYTDDTSAPSYNPSPAPVEPISPFYGSCHSYDC
jgi:hypothetical protein